MGTEFHVALIAFFGVVLSAVVSWITTWFTLKRAGSQKLAEYRKEWIEELRKKIASFVTVTFDRELEKKTKKIDGPISEAERKMILDQTHIYMEILMYLNPAEVSHRNLEERLAQMSEMTTNYVENSIIPLSRAVLKTEWDRLKTEI